MRSNFAAAFLLLGLACMRNSATAPLPPATAAEGPVVALPDGFVVHVEIAADDETRQQGLMFRDRLAEDGGMLFFFPESGEYPFWMKNTLIPLDMIWIDENRRVVHVKEGVPPCKADPCPSYPPNARARYVLELASGVARKHRVSAGAVLDFRGTEKVIIR